VVAGVSAALVVLVACTGSEGRSTPSTRTATPGPVRVWAYGDGPDGQPAAEAVARFVSRRSPETLLYLGDVDGPYATRMDAVLGEVGLAARTMPTPGDQDWPAQRAHYLAYWSNVHARPMGGYYARRVGSWEVLSLNSEIRSGPESSQYRWLQRQLAEPGSCRLAFWHRPRFSASRQGDFGKVDALWQSLSGRAVLVLSGHEHAMMQMVPRDGLVQLVSGAGGQSNYGVDESDSRLAWGDDRADGALALELGEKEVTWQFVSVEGDVLHEGRAPCRPLRTS
jgi:hypothetical protein